MQLPRLSSVLLGSLLSVWTLVGAAEGTAPASAKLVLSGDVVRDGARLEVIEEKSGAIQMHRWEGQSSTVSVSVTPLVLCTFDPSGRATGLFRIAPRPGEEIQVDRLPSPPRDKGQLYLTLAFPSSKDTQEIQRDVAVRLIVGERPYPPDVVVKGGDLLRSFWFGAPSGYASVDVVSQFWATEKPVDLTVPQRNAIALRPVALHRRPALRVRLDGSERLPVGEVTFELFPCDRFKEFVDNSPRLSDCDRPTVRTGKADGEFVFPSLVPATYAYRWKLGNLSAAGWIRVPDFEDLEKRIQVDLYAVSGAVQRHGRGILAHLVFEPPNTGSTFETDTDHEGRYQISLAEKARYSVKVQTAGFPEFPESVNVQRDTTKDFDLPSNRYRTLVVSADDGKPMAQVRIDYEVRSATGDRSSGFSSKGFTGADGVLELAPVPSGELQVRARQIGYRPVSVPPIRVDDKSAGDDIPISLVKAPTITIRLLEPDGSPSLGGFVWAETGGLRGTPFTAEDGTTTFDVELPAGAPLFAFDTRGRMAFARYSGEKQQDVTIPASGPPVSIRFQTATGQPVAGAFVGVGVDGVLMQYGPIAQQAFWSGTEWRTAPDGAARIFGLPADGLLTVFPRGGAEYSVTRRLPLTEDIVITLPVRDPQKPKLRKQESEETAELLRR